MSRKYLDELNIDYPTLFIGDIKRKKERFIYGFDERETWDLQYSFYAWLYERLMMYKERASKVIDLEYHTVNYKGKVLTQIECIDKIIEDCKEYLIGYYNGNTDWAKTKEITELWHLIIYKMWW